MSPTQLIRIQLFENAHALTCHLYENGGMHGFNISESGDRPRLIIDSDPVFEDRSSAVSRLEKLLMNEVSEFCIGELGLPEQNGCMSRAFVTRIIGALRTFNTVDTCALPA